MPEKTSNQFKRKIASLSLRALSEHEREGVKIAFRFMFKHLAVLSIMMVAGLLAAIFEGGTIGLLGLAVSILTGGEAAGYGIELPDAIQGFVDSRLENVSTGGVFLLLVGIAVAAQVVKSVLVYISTLAQISLTYGLQGHAQERATNHAMALKYEEVTKYPSGAIVSMIDQAGILSDVVSEFSKAVRAVFMVTAYTVVMLLVSPLLSFAALVLFGLLYVSINKIITTLRKLSRQSFISTIDTARWAVELIGAPRVLRVFSSGEYAEGKIKQSRDRRIAADKKSTQLIAIIMPSFEVVTVFGAGLFLVTGYLLAGDNANTIVPKLFVFILVFFRMKPQIIMLNNLRVSFSKLLPQIELVGEFLHPVSQNYERVGGKTFQALEKRIDFKGVTFSYPGSSNNALNSLNLNIQKGEMVALVGASGSGKTTLTSLMLGLYEATAGEVLVDGRNINVLNLEEWRRRIGVVDQDIFLLHATILENIQLGNPDVELEQVKQAAIEAGADQFIRGMSNGYDTVIGDRGFKLSGGQQQRIALARALARRPEILILDEATSALDSVSEQLFQEAIGRLRGNTTILAIAHRLSTIEKADQIIVLENGRVREMGDKATLLKNADYFSKVWNLQKTL